MTKRRTKSPPKNPKPCSVEGCKLNASGRGLCNKHYLATWREGALPTRTPAERFISRSVAFTTEQNIRINRLVAYRLRHGIVASRASLYREMVDAFFNGLSTEEQDAISKPMPMSFD